VTTKRIALSVNVRAGGNGEVSGNGHSRLRVKIKTNLRAGGDGEFVGGGRS
jgi:hypothetical protein